MLNGIICGFYVNINLCVVIAIYFLEYKSEFKKI